MKSGLLLTAALLAAFLGETGAAWADPWNFVTLQVPGAISTTAPAINDANQFVGNYLDFLVATPGFGYSSGSYSAIDIPGQAATTALGISNSAQVTGSYTDGGGGSHGFVQTGFPSGPQTTFDDPSGVDATNANGIGDGRTIVGSYIDGSTTHGFSDVGGSHTPLDVPGSTATSATGINTARDIVGYYADGGGASRGLVDVGHNTVMTVNNPNAAPGGLTEVMGTNDQLAVVGYYVDPNGIITGFTAEVPEPGSMALFGFAALCIARMRRRGAVGA